MTHDFSALGHFGPFFSFFSAIVREKIKFSRKNTLEKAKKKKKEFTLVYQNLP